jgi:hypothetical protein
LSTARNLFRSTGREILIFVLFLALTVLNTWPLARNLSSALSDPGDPYFTTWLLEWDWWATVQRRPLFHAPIFHPAKYTLAFSENMYGIALVLFPFYAVGLPPVTVHGIGVLLGFAFCGYGAFVLARLVTGSFAGALAAGIFYAFVPFRLTHLPHIQFIWGGWLPLLLAALIWHRRAPSWTGATLFGAAFLMNGLSNIHLLLFSAVTLVLSVLLLLLTDARTRLPKFWGTLGVATGAASLLLLPFLLPYRTVSELYGMKRTRAEAIGWSAKAQDWMIMWPPNRTYGHLPNARHGSSERLLFPGVLSLLFASSALLLARRSDFPFEAVEDAAPSTPGLTRSGGGAPRIRWRWKLERLPQRLHYLDAFIVVAAILGYYRSAADKEQWPDFGVIALVLLIIRLSIRLPEAWGGSEGRSLLSGLRILARRLRPHPERWRFPAGVRLALLWIVVGFLGSRGLRTFFYRFLFENIDVFRGLRVPARFAVVAYVGLAVLIAAGMLPLLRRFGRRGRAVVGTLVALLFLAELRAAPIRWYLTLPDPPPVYSWLATAPISGAILELPMGNYEDAEYVFRSTTHHRPIVNGISGFFPKHHYEILVKSSATPVDPSLMPILERIGCSLLVVHNDNMNVRPEVRQWLKDEIAQGRLVFVRRFDHLAGGDYVFALTRTEPQASGRLRLPEMPDPSGFTPSQNAQRFLDGYSHIYNSSTFGWLDSPMQSLDVYGKLRVSGWALSPHGVERVHLRFENGAVVVPAELWPWKEVVDIYPWYRQTHGPGFYRDFPARPAGVSAETDLQVEIIDGSGKRTRLKQVMFRWFPPRGIRFEEWDANALDGLLNRMGFPAATERPRVVEKRSSIQQLAYAWAGRLASSSDEEFLDAVYRTLLRRPIDSMGRAHYLDKMAGGESRQEVLDAILHSTEFADLYEKK